MLDYSIYNGKKVLITGATGFKGSWLAIWLKQLGANVVGYSLPPKSKKDNYVTCNVENLIIHKNGDIRDLKSVKEFLLQTKPEIIFHLAAQPIVLQSYKDPVENFETNIIGTVNILEAARHTNSVKAIINVTTDKVYKNNEQIWGFREFDELAGKDPYSASKSCSEIITQSYQYAFLKDKGIKIATARAGNVIGGGDWAKNRIVPDFFRALKANKKLILRNPMATRPWQHVLESLSGYLALGTALFSSDKFSEGWNFGPLNNNEAYSVAELIDEFNKYHPEVIVEKAITPQSQKEARFLKLDISKAISILKWKPVLNFHDTIKFTQEGYISDIKSNSIQNNRIQQIETYMNLINTEFQD